MLAALWLTPCNVIEQRGKPTSALVEELHSLFPPGDNQRIRVILRALRESDHEQYCDGRLEVAKIEKAHLLYDDAATDLTAVVTECENHARALYELADLAARHREYCPDAMEAIEGSGQQILTSEAGYLSTLAAILA
jgi:hypothetical protein